VHAGVAVVDDAGESVALAAPASRVVSLAPHATELVYAAGGAATLVGAVSYSDYPAAAKMLPRVGSNTSIDLERIAALKPDLVVAWRHGGANRTLEALRALHIPVFVSAPRRVDDVATNLERLGTLLGTATAAQAAAERYRSEVAQLRARYSGRPPVSVFYEVWDRPLMTLNGTQFVSDAIALCGGRNVFGQLAASVPTVTTEAVVAADPEAIVTASAGATTPAAGRALPSLAAWQAWPQITAVARGNLFAIDGDLINRPGPRLPQGIAALCADLDTARERRPNASTR
jgi:iron complex transport system substrate-binding protein